MTFQEERKFLSNRGATAKTSTFLFHCYPISTFQIRDRHNKTNVQRCSNNKGFLFRHLVIEGASSVLLQHYGKMPFQCLICVRFTNSLYILRIVQMMQNKWAFYGSFKRHIEFCTSEICIIPKVFTYIYSQRKTKNIQQKMKKKCKFCLEIILKSCITFLDVLFLAMYVILLKSFM